MENREYIVKGTFKIVIL